MRRHVLSLTTLLMVAAAGNVQALEGHMHHLSCSYSSDYDMHIQTSGIAFTRGGGHPQYVFIHAGVLRVDGEHIVVSDADAARLREYEYELRDLLPAMAGIARDGVEIGYAALTTVMATLSDTGKERSGLLRELHDRHNQAMQRIDDTLGQGRWDPGNEDDLFGDDLQKTVADLVSHVTGDIVRDALSGDSGRLASLQARTDALDAAIDKAVQAPAEKLGQRAEALCPRLSHLRGLQQQFQFRLPSGERLQLIDSNTGDSNMDRTNKASYAQR